MAKQNEKSTMSQNQMKKVSRKKEIQKMKRRTHLMKVLSICIIALIGIGLVSFTGYTIYKNATKIKPSSDYSAYLTDDGLIKDVTATDYINLTDYSNITAPLSEVEYTDETMKKDIQALLDDHRTLDKETTALIKDGDTVNIDYVGTVDGKEFDGGNTEGNGTDLEIGSGSYVDDFEDQLIGHAVGDKVTVNVTFPTDYSDKNLAGKDAVFEVTINGIYVSPEFTDAFVKENLSDYASTADEYKAYLKKKKYEENLTTWLENYLVKKTTVKSYPKKYTNHLKSLKKYEDQLSYEYMNKLYTSSGYDSFSSFEDYIGMSEAKYDASLVKDAKDQAKKALILQAIYEKDGLTVTKDDYNTYFDTDTSGDYDKQVEQYGKGYVMQEIMFKKVLDKVKDSITVK